MIMFGKIAQFEFRYQLKNPVFWVTAIIFFLLTFAATTVESVRIGATTNVHKNSPFSIDQVSGIMTVFGIFTLVAFVASVIVRDDDTGFGPIIRSTRVKKFDYLIGRFTGAFAAAALAMTSVQIGVALGSLMPWVDPDTLGPFVPAHYLYGFFAVTLPSLFLTGALFFALATATRSMMATYIGVVAFLIFYFTANIIFDKPQYEHTAALLDPFGLGALQLATKYWTAVERNTLVPAISGVVLYNRLIWFAVSLAMLGLAYAVFRFDVVGLPAAEKPAKTKADPPPAIPLRPATPSFGAASQWAQCVARTRIDMAGIFKSPAFFVLLALGLLNALGALWTAEELYDVPVYPVTRAMIGQLRNSFTIMPVIIAIYYAGELVWRDRDRRVHEIIDATPVADWMYAVPKILALFLVLVSALLASVVTALLVQTIKGWHHYELYHYLSWYIVPESLAMLIMAVFAIFVQAVSPVKYVGWGIMGLYILSTIMFNTIGWEDNLYQIDGSPTVPLSDMNGQGQYWIARLWFLAYWGVFASILALFTHYLWRRGTEQRLMPRLRRLPRRLAGAGGVALALLLCGFIGLGATIYDNTHVLNEYRTARGNEKYLAEYERALLPFEHTPQPRITDVKLVVDLYPHALSAHAAGTYTLVNRTGKPLDRVHVRWWRGLRMDSLKLDGASPEKNYGKFNYVIFKLDTPMAPGETRHLTFDATMPHAGFTNSNAPLTPLDGHMADNGSFIRNLMLSPELGMDRGDLLTDRIKRRKYGLPPELRPAKLDDEGARGKNVIRSDSDWVTADITLSTVADQIPIAPGTKVSDITQNGRRICRFVSDAPILNYFSLQSAAYQVATAKHGDVDLAVYYDPAHGMNVQHMLDTMKLSLDTYDQVFSPYQFHQARILEFPAYATFAESFANTIPFSESIGFVLDERDPDAVDAIAYVTAHEMGHQWWGHQVIAADKQGGTMLVESFAQYSAMLVMERMKGPDSLRKFLKYELNAYLRARGTETVEETPLDRVEDKPYIHYRKGSVAMWFLADQLGEDTVNRAMRRLIKEYAFKPAPYPDTRDFIRYLREEAGPGHDQIITDTLERITLYDVNVHAVHSQKRPDGKYDVTIDVDAHKYYANGYGKETEAPLAETFDVGLFAKEPGQTGFSKADVISLTRMPVHTGRQTLTLVADSKPAFGGVDPYNKRITRNADTVLAAAD
jgi:ABC-type transport system involved in multi-copper enzyme maturation permease subunit